MKKSEQKEQLLSVTINGADNLINIAKHKTILLESVAIHLYLVDWRNGNPLLPITISIKPPKFNRCGFDDFQPKSSGEIMKIVWNEEFLLTDLVYKNCGDEDLMLLFEIVSNNEKMPLRIGWAFLKLHNSLPNMHVARLQLYKYRDSIIKWADTRDSGRNMAYICWKNKRKPLKCTLFVTVEKRSNIAQMGYRKPPINIEDTLDMKATGENEKSVEIPWRRMSGQQCKIPNRKSMVVESSKGGCSCLAFSSSGFYLAAACISASLFPIKIVDIISGEKITILDGHQDVVYELVWSEDESLLMSASSDGTVRVWDVFEDRINSPKLLAIYQHPCFVYSSKFFPNTIAEKAKRLILSGAYDHSIRVWCLEKPANMSGYRAIPELSPIQTIEGHGSYVNTLCFDKQGTKLFTGDGKGIIKIWTCSVENEERQNETGHGPLFQCIHTLSLSNDSPVNYLQLHLSSKKVLITSRDGWIRVYDLRFGRTILEIEPTLPDHSPSSKRSQRICQTTSDRSPLRRAIFSPCGNYIIVGGADAIESQFFPENSTDRINNITAVTFHPFDHMLAAAGMGDGDQISIYTNDE